MSDQSRQLVEQVQQALVEGRTLEICGGGSKHFLGRENKADDRLEVSEHTGVVSYQPLELVLTARAGTSIREIQNALDSHDQMLAFEPPIFDQWGKGATLGGTLASNQSGPARPWRGSIRDAVLGIRLINGNGEHSRFGGQVIKNVAGYDVSRAQAGALGTLGVITEISLKVMPKPETSLTLVSSMSAADAIYAMNTLSGKATPLTAACWMDERLYLRWSGVKAAVGSAAEDAKRSLGAELLPSATQFWCELTEHRHEFFAGEENLWRFSNNSAAPHWREGSEWLIEWGGAQRWLRGEQYFSELEKEAKLAGGQVALFRGGDRSGEVFATQPEAIQGLHKRLKAAFDPKGIFNPGRLYSWM